VQKRVIPFVLATGGSLWAKGGERRITLVLSLSEGSGVVGQRIITSHADSKNAFRACRPHRVLRSGSGPRKRSLSTYLAPSIRLEGVWAMMSTEPAEISVRGFRHWLGFLRAGTSAV
jgi:hypothetical protein